MYFRLVCLYASRYASRTMAGELMEEDQRCPEDLLKRPNKGKLNGSSGIYGRSSAGARACAYCTRPLPRDMSRQEHAHCPARIKCEYARSSRVCLWICLIPRLFPHACTKTGGKRGGGGSGTFITWVTSGRLYNYVWLQCI